MRRPDRLQSRTEFVMSSSPLHFACFLLTFASSVSQAAADVLPTAPAGFKVTLFAKDPNIAHPTALTTAPGGVVFAAEDYWNAKRPGVPETSVIKRFVDRDGDGVADETKVFWGENLGSVQGLRWLDGTLYAMHAPILSAIRDVDGDGKAEERKDILVGIKPNSRTDVAGHLISGVTSWIDGRLYITCGDQGWWKCKTPEGGEFELHGGGILRCWPDGKGLETYCTGLRNPYGTMAIDADGNGFTTDNTNDGKGWNERFSEIFRHAFYGYPYHFKNYPEEIVPCLDDYGGGSPTGSLCYLEDRFPDEYHGNLFVNEWGGRIVYRVTLKPDGPVLRPTRKEFLSGGSEGGYIFRPIALDVDEDGNLMVADWAQDGWDKGNGRGRIFRVSPVGGGRAAPGAKKKSVDGWAADLASPRFTVRYRAQRELERVGAAAAAKLRSAVSSGPVHARIHAMWGLAHVEKEKVAPLLIKQLDASEDRIRLHAARILGDGAVGPGGVDALIAHVAKDTPRVRIECAAALGSLKAAKAAPALLKAAATDDLYMHRLIACSLRAMGETTKTAEALNDKDARVADAALLAFRERFEVPVVQGLILAVRSHADAAFRVRLVRALVRVGKKPAPWDGNYWSFWPNVDTYPFGTEAWDGTDKVLRALEELAGDSHSEVRAQAELGLKNLGGRASAAGAAPGAQDLPKSYKELVALARQSTAPMASRLAAYMALRGLSDLAPADAKARDALVSGFPKTLSSGTADLKIEVLQALPKSRAPFAGSWIAERLNDGEPRVREVALRALIELDDPAAPAAAKRLLADKAPETRHAAVRAYAKLATHGADPAPLQGLLKDPDKDLAREAMAALIQIKRDAAQALPQDALTPFVRRWLAVGPFPDADGKGLDTAFPPEKDLDLAAQYDGDGGRVGWKDAASDADTVSLAAPLGARDRGLGYALAVVEATEECEALLLAGSDGGLKVWVNGELVHVKKAQRTVKPDEDVVRARLRPGANALLVKATSAAGKWGICLRIAAPRARALLKFPAPREGLADTRRARLSQLALQGGDPKAGEGIFRGGKVICAKCHTAKGAGGKIAPDLSSVGAKYLRPHLIESILYPSRQLAQGFQAVSIVTTDERVLSGVVASESADRLVLAGSDGNTVEIPKADIAERLPQTVSIMPEGQERGLTDEEFVNLVSFLESLK